jgi:hypothetical protein
MGFTSKSKYDIVLKELLYVDIVNQIEQQKENKKIYYIKEGVGEDIEYVVDNDYSSYGKIQLIEVESQHEGTFNMKYFNFDYLSQSFVKFGVVYEDEQEYNQWKQEYNQLMDIIHDKESPMVNTWLTCVIGLEYRRDEKQECMICLQPQRRFSVCETCDKECCIKCARQLFDKELKSDYMRTPEVKCPFCRSIFSSIYWIGGTGQETMREKDEFEELPDTVERAMDELFSGLLNTIQQHH